MTNKAIETELIDLEHKYWDAIKDKDVEAAMQLTDDSCIVAGAQGVSPIDRQSFAGMLSGGDWTLRDFQLLDPIHVKRLTDDVAVVGYKVREELTVEGKPITLEAADTSTWTRRGGRWVCSSHTEAVAGDPFGRDRRQRQGMADTS